MKIAIFYANILIHTPSKNNHRRLWTLEGL